MCKVTIRPITFDSILVRKKVVHKNKDGIWTPVSSLSESEQKAFDNYKEKVLDNDKVSILPMATYRFNTKN